MNPTDGGIPQAKMSKSDPASTIPIPASRELVEERLRGAFCPPREVEGNPVVELALHVVFPWEGALEIEAPRTAGPAKRYTGADEFQDAWKRGEVHPADLKAAVSRSLQRILEPAKPLLRELTPDAPGPRRRGPGKGRLTSGARRAPSLRGRFLFGEPPGRTLPAAVGQVAKVSQSQA